MTWTQVDQTEALIREMAGKDIQDNAVYWHGGFNGFHLIDTARWLYTMLNYDDKARMLDEEFARTIERDVASGAHPDYIEIADEWVLRRSRQTFRGEGTIWVEDEFNRPWQVNLFHPDGSQDVCAVIHFGVGRPRVFSVIDIDYFFDWKVEYYCRTCHSDVAFTDAECLAFVKKADTDGDAVIIHKACNPSLVLALADWDATTGQPCPITYHDVVDVEQGRVEPHNSGDGF